MRARLEKGSLLCLWVRRESKTRARQQNLRFPHRGGGPAPALTTNLNHGQDTRAGAPFREKRGCKQTSERKWVASKPQRAGIQTSRFTRVASAGRTLNMYTGKNTGGIRSARCLHLADRLRATRGDALGAGGGSWVGGKGGVCYRGWGLLSRYVS